MPIHSLVRFDLTRGRCDDSINLNHSDDSKFNVYSRHNNDWDAEIEYSQRAIDLINEMEPRPAFVCVFGDLVDMEFSLERKKGGKSKFPSSLFNGETGELVFLFVQVLLSCRP